MKKKFIYLMLTLIVAAVLAGGCGKKKQQEPSQVTEETQESEKETEETEETEAETETEELPEVGEIFKVDIETIDGSRRDDEGNLLANIYMQYPVVYGKSEAVDVINDYYKDARTSYSPLNSSVLEIVDIDLADGVSLENFPYEDRIDCIETCNNGKYLCLISYSNWYAGGVSNTFAFGDVFSSVTGEHLTLADFYPDKTPEQVKNMVVEKCKAYFDQTPDDGWNLDVVKEYNVEDYNYYLLDGTVYVCFGPYEVSFGGWYRDVPIDTY